MKKLIGSVTIFCLLSLSAMAQSGTTTKIHFFNGVLNYGTTDLKIVAGEGEGKTISVKQRTWVILEIAGDSLGFLVNDKPYFVHFEPGKSYYFIATKGYFSQPTITEETERAFIMTVNINSAKGPEQYKLGKLAN